MDPYAKLRFSQTIKIDPELKAAIDSIDFHPKTLAVLKEKGFEYLTPVQSQSYEHVSSGVDVVARSRTGRCLYF
jgi:superfamily II DNA/RNA helicase